jgi:hypothetical protein
MDELLVALIPPRRRASFLLGGAVLLTVYFGTPSMFITLWFGFD